jgi:glycine/D-amino acid oxidase-like deaminating enzyme
MANYRNNSLWWDNLPAELMAANRPPLANDLAVDVAIVGGGYTGLWTAYYLNQRNPNLEIAVIDANVVGFGASGRNGGWCSSYFPTSIDKLAKKFGADAARNLQQAMHSTVAEVAQVIAQENIACDWQRGGSVSFARSELQRSRALAEVSNWQKWGFGSADYAYLDANETNEIAQVTHNFGALYSSHVAAIQPAKLVRQLARILEKNGIKIFEQTAARQISPGVLTTSNGVIRAKYIVRATEGYTANIKKLKREVAPVYSLMIATEPLSDEIWQEIGLANRQTFSDGRNLIIYGQRTADNRIAFGGRGAPYHFGSKIKNEFDLNRRVHNLLPRILAELFPVLTEVPITHYWGGPLGITRDWMASVGLDQATGLAWAGGYVGDGVGTSNLAGRTLADLITQTESDLTKLPWVNHRSPKWEIEPLRWLGTNLGLQAMTLADYSENLTTRSSRIPKLVGYFTGK